MKLFIGMLVVVSMLAVCSCDEKGEEGPSNQTELACVELSVAACMAAPDIPMRSLNPGSEPRISFRTSCKTPLTIPYEHADDAAMVAAGYTRDVDALINVNEAYAEDIPVQRLTEFIPISVFHNWYCVYDDGKVVGYTGMTPRQNIREM